MKEAVKLIRKKVAELPKTDNLVEDLYNNLNSYFNGEGTSGTHLGNVLNKYLKIMESQSKSSFDARASLSLLLDLSKETQGYIDSKKAADKDFIIYNLQKNLFPWQKPVYEDDSKIVSLMAGRRSGKSFVVADKMIKHCVEGSDLIEQDGVKIRKKRKAIYIGLTIEKAASIMWDLLKDHIEKNRIPIKKIDNGKYSIIFSNDNEIQLLGNNSKAEREKIRGLDFSFAAIDEMQSQQGVNYLITSIIQPILKGRNGQLTLMGTGPLSAGTYWEQQLNNNEIKHYSATMADNPSIPDYKNALEEVLKQNGWTKDNITFRREYLGEVAYDTNVMVYPIRKYYGDSELKQFKPVKCAIGVDFGWTDSTTFAPILIDAQNNMLLVNEFKAPHMAATAIIEKCKEMNDFIHNKYNLPMEDIYIITDNNEQNITRDIYNKGVTNIQCAYKQGESYQIAMVKDLLESGQLLVKKEDYFDDECNKVCWQIDENGNIIYQLDDKLYHGDMVDAVKYAVNFIISYIN